MLDRRLLLYSTILIAACTGLKDPDWDTAGQRLQGGSEWRDDGATGTGGDEATDGSAGNGGTEGPGSDGETMGVEDGTEDGGPEDDGTDDGGTEDSGSGDGESDAGASTGAVDGGGEDGDSEDDGGVGGDGGVAAGVGGLVQFIYNANAYAAELEVAVVDVSVLARLHPPMTGSWLSWMPSLGLCTIDPLRASLGAIGSDMGASATLTSGSAIVPMLRDATTNSYKAEDLPMSSWVTSSSYSIQFSDGIRIDNAVNTTAGFDAISPAILSEGDSVYPFFTELSMSGTTFTWSPAGLDDGILISLMVHDSSTMAAKVELLCNAPDIGSFTIPSSAFYSSPLMSVGDPVFAGIWRYRRSYSINPVDGSVVEGFAQKGAIGTGTLAP